MKRIAVIGPVPRDYIITHQGDLIQKWGGICHPVIGISALDDPLIEVIPVTHVRNVDRDNVLDVLKDYKNIDTDFITTKHDQGDIITLKFIDINNRLERQTGFMDPILKDDFKKLLDCDAYVFVPISDYQISLESLKFLKEKSQGLIIFDAHGPTTVCLTNGERQRKLWIERDHWLPYIDVLKMNIEEAKASWFKKEYESSDFHDKELSEKTLKDFAEHCFSFGVKCVYITLDSRGCFVYFKEAGKKVIEHFEPAVKVNEVIDTTGCGDSFAGGIAYSLVNYPGDYIRAAKYGNALGAMRTQGKTFDVFRNLSEVQSIIEAGVLSN